MVGSHSLNAPAIGTFSLSPTSCVGIITAAIHYVQWAVPLLKFHKYIHPCIDWDKARRSITLVAKTVILGTPLALEVDDRAHVCMQCGGIYDENMMRQRFPGHCRPRSRPAGPRSQTFQRNRL